MTGSGYFVAGTDTGVGKTLIASALLHAFAARGKSVIGMKPVAAGCAATPAGLRCDDVEQLKAHANVVAPTEWINPYALAPAIAPHIAAAQAGVEIDLDLMAARCHGLRQLADVVIVEGVGGFLVPLNATEDMGDFAARIGLPVILVVGMRLGCLSHALLTARAIAAAGLPLAGWVANRVDPGMAAFEENLAALGERLPAPLLGAVQYHSRPDAEQIAGALALEKLLQ